MSRKKRKISTARVSMRTGNIRAELVSAEVDNPYFAREHAESQSNPKTIAVFKNVRESAVATLASKGALDAPQVAAADRFRRWFETMGGAGARAIDWRKEAVDGGRFPDPIGDHAIDAGKQLAAAYEVLTNAHGIYAWKLVGYVCGEGRSIHELTQTRRQRDTMTDNLRSYLDCLAEHWGFSTKAKAIRQ